MKIPYNVFLGSYSFHSVSNLPKLSAEEVARAVYISTGNKPPEGYSLVGTAEVEITLLPAHAINANQIANLREIQRKARVDAQTKVMECEQAIQKLLAIGMDETAGVAA